MFWNFARGTYFVVTEESKQSKDYNRLEFRLFSKKSAAVIEAQAVDNFSLELK